MNVVVSPHSSFPFLSRQDLRSLQLKQLGKEGWSKAQILHGEIEGKKFIVKDFQEKSFLVRWFLGRSAIRKEWSVYNLLAGVEGIPVGYQKLDSLAIIVQFVEGVPIRRNLNKRLDLYFFQRLHLLVDRIHARGIAHLDLRQKRNILIDGQNNPHIVDFSSAFTQGHLPILRRILFPLLKRIDKSGIHKFKYRYAPHLLTTEEDKAVRKHRLLKRLWIFRLLKR